MEAYRILLADGHSLFRSGVKRILEESKKYQVVGESEDEPEVLRLIKKTQPDLLICDVFSPKLRGLETIRRIKTNHPSVKILILTTCRSRDIIYHAYHSRVNAYLLKDDNEEELFTAIEAVLSDRYHLSSILSKEMTCDFITICFRGGKLPQESLTVREIGVMKLIAEGKSGKEIAENLHISARTVDHHRSRVMKKLNLRKNVELVKFALNKGYIS